MPQQRYRGKRGSGALRKVNVRISHLNKRVQGRQLRPSADPPSFNQIPWNTLVIGDSPETGDDGFKTYNGVDIWGIIQAQIGLKTTSVFSIRILEIRGWLIETTTTVESNFINLQVQDFTIGMGTSDYQVQIEDYGGKNRWAKVGYSLPISQNKVIFTSLDTEELFRFGSISKARLAIRVKLLWKPRVFTLPNHPSHRNFQPVSQSSTSGSIITTSDLENRLQRLEVLLSNINLGVTK